MFHSWISVKHMQASARSTAWLTLGTISWLCDSIVVLLYGLPHNWRVGPAPYSGVRDMEVAA